MRCECCDKIMSPEEIQYIQEEKTFDYCTTCLDIAMEAAYSGDFKRNEEELTEVDDDLPFKYDGEVETLDLDTYQSTLEGGDAYDIPWNGDGDE